jgi:hypothetical protein
MDTLTLFGLFAVTAMLIFYAFEASGRCDVALAEERVRIGGAFSARGPQTSLSVARAIG